MYDGSPGFRPTVLEIGFGMGEAGLAALVRRLDAAGLTNVRLVDGDAVDVLTALPSASLDEVRLFFPDPWPKTRHVKRRFLRPSTAALLADRLAPQGFLHLATDWPPYAEHAREVLAGWDVQQVERGARPVTGYERRGHRAGRQAVDLVFRPAR